MKTDEIRKRLINLEEKAALKDALILVRFPDGSEGKVSVAEWYDNRYEWVWLDPVANTACPAPAYFIFHDLFEKAIDEGIRAGKTPDDPEMKRYQQELDYFRRVLIGE